MGNLENIQGASSRKEQRRSEGWRDGQCVGGTENEERCVRDEAAEAKSGQATQCFLEQVRSFGFIPSDERPLKVLGGGKG